MPGGLPLGCYIVPVTPLQQNCSIVWCVATKRAALVDPGGDVDRILAEVAKKDVTVEKILVTHGHVDHAGGVAELVARLGVPVEGPHPDDAFLLERLAEDGARYGIVGARSFTPTRWLDEGDQVIVGDLSFDVLRCPGHTPGHVVFINPAARLALVGDVLFNGSIGRTDFPRSDPLALIHSITEKLWPLGSDMAFIPGHGPPSTFGEERLSNQFVADRVLARRH